MDPAEGVAVTQAEGHQRWAAGVAPFVLFGCVLGGLRWTLSNGSVMPRAYVTLSLGFVGLCLAGFWLSRDLFILRAARLALVGATGILCLGWLAQRIAYVAFVPDRFLKYGYFLTPPGTRARFALLELPFWVVSAGLVISLAVALRAAWGDGARTSLAALLVWWLTAFVLFAIPSLYLLVQGDAALFI